MTIKIENLNAADPVKMHRMAEILVEGFYEAPIGPGLKFISKDKKKLSKAFAHVFNHKAWKIAIMDEKIVGILGCGDENIQSFNIKKREFQKHLGRMRGWFAHFATKKLMRPHRFGADTVNVEALVVCPSAQGKGVAKLLMQDVENRGHKRAVLEVVDKNHGAVQLYEKLGYRKFEKKLAITWMEKAL
jgi:GNAT superfamily N-acetyltransferase